MIWLVIFLCIMFFGLGYFTREVIDGIKFLNEMVQRRKHEDEEMAQKFSKSVQNITEDLIKSVSKDMNSLKSTVKKTH